MKLMFLPKRPAWTGKNGWTRTKGVDLHILGEQVSPKLRWYIFQYGSEVHEEPRTDAVGQRPGLGFFSLKRNGHSLAFARHS